MTNKPKDPKNPLDASKTHLNSQGDKLNKAAEKLNSNKSVLLNIKRRKIQGSNPTK